MEDKSNNNKIYAVRGGRRCGVFFELDKLLDSVRGFKYSEFDEFESLVQADSYLTTYATVYGDHMLPPFPEDEVWVQVFCQPVKVANDPDITYVCSAACCNNRFVALSDHVQPYVMETVVLAELIKGIEDDGVIKKIVIGSYVADSKIQIRPGAVQGKREPRIVYPETVDAGTKCIIVDAIANGDTDFKDDNLNAEVQRVYEALETRNNKLTLETYESAKIDRAIFGARCALSVASQIVQRRLIELQQQGKKPEA